MDILGERLLGSVFTDVSVVFIASRLYW